jgi:hypothetical protein
MIGSAPADSQHASHLLACPEFRELFMPQELARHHSRWLLVLPTVAWTVLMLGVVVVCPSGALIYSEELHWFFPPTVMVVMIGIIYFAFAVPAWILGAAWAEALDLARAPKWLGWIALGSVGIGMLFYVISAIYTPVLGAYYQ